jgi:hypothetical protein
MRAAVCALFAVCACGHVDERELATGGGSIVLSPAPAATHDIVVAPPNRASAASCPEGSHYIEERGCVAFAPPIDRTPAMEANPAHLDPCGSWESPRTGVNDCDPDEEGGPDVGFARGRALRTIFDAKIDLARCKKPGGPSGAGRIEITYAPDGSARSSRAIGEPFAGSGVGQCVAEQLKKIKVPAFKQRELTVVAHFELK